MISRRTARMLSDLMAETFKRAWGLGNRASGYRPDGDPAYDFLYDKAYAAWFCNAAKNAAMISSSNTRHFKEFFMKVHTGESLVSATQTWTWEQRERLGQELLEQLCQDMDQYWQNPTVSYSLN